MHTWLSDPRKVLLSFISLAIILRFFSFFPSVMDHDESTYILIADAILDGKVYLRDIIDTKPVGIFYLFAIFQSVFGNSILAIRVITAICVGLTGWFLFLIHRQIGREAGHKIVYAPLASGLIYIFVISVYTIYGVSPNTEHFFSLFTVVALFIMLRFPSPGGMALSGILLGMGFMIKYVVLFDAAAFGLFFIWMHMRSGRPFAFALYRTAIMGISFCVPFVLTWAYYKGLGMEESFWFYTYEVSGNYFLRPPAEKYVVYLLESFFRFIPVVIWYFFCLFQWKKTGPALPFLGGLWGGLVLIIILLPGKLFGHYFIQFLLPLSLLAGSFFDSRHSPGKYLSWMRKPVVGLPLLVLFTIVHLSLQKRDYYDRPDYPRQVAGFLNERMQPGDLIYTGNFDPITYLLTDTESPTPYIHRSLLWTSYNSGAMEVNPEKEWARILARRPRFIIMEDPIVADHAIAKTLESEYTIVKTFGQEVEVYEHRRK